MTDTLFADISYFQPVVNDTYPYKFLSIRSNDGTFCDPNFAKNLAWCKSAVDRKIMAGFIVYFVWEPNWQETVATMKAMVGTPHAKMAVMVDVESWGGRIKGDQSVGLNGARESIIKWLGGNRKRVFGYGNAGDLNTLWPTRGDMKIILANYSSNPAFPGKIAHQFSSSYSVAPFGKCDINSADGYSPDQFATALGLVAPVVKPVVTANTPTGHMDVFKVSNRPVQFKGWAVDMDNPSAAVTIRIYQDGVVLKNVLANLPRPDVNKARNLPGNHGFDITFPAPAGSHTYKVYAMTIGGGANWLMGTYKV